MKQELIDGKKYIEEPAAFGRLCVETVNLS